MDRSKRRIYYNIIAISFLIFLLLISFALGEETDSATTEEKDIMPAVILIFWFIISVILGVILVETISQAFKRKNWWVALPGTTKLVSLGQYSYQIKLANNFYLIHFNKINENQQLQKKKKKKDADDEKEDDDPNRKFLEVEKIETPSTVYSRYPVEYIFSKDGGVIWQYHRICHLFKLIELDIPEHIEIFEKIVPKKFGSRLRYGLYKFPVQYIPLIRNAWFKWVLKKMVKGERLTKVPFLVFTLMEERYFNLYDFSYRTIRESFKSIDERYSEIIKLKKQSGEILEGIRSSQNSFLCENCKKCKLIDECFTEMGVDYTHKEVKKILKDSQKKPEEPNIDFKKLEMQLNKATKATLKIDETTIEEEEFKKILNEIRKMHIIEKYKRVRKFICKDYDKKYKINFVGTKTLIPDNEKQALEKQESREQIMASHLQTAFSYSQAIKDLGVENLDLKKENMKLFATLESRIATSLGDMKDEMPDLKKQLAAILKVSRLGYQDMDSIGKFLLKMEGVKTPEMEMSGNGVEQPNSQDMQNIKALQTENRVFDQLLSKVLPPDQYSSIKNMLEEQKKVAYYNQQ